MILSALLFHSTWIMYFVVVLRLFFLFFVCFSSSALCIVQPSMYLTLHRNAYVALGDTQYSPCVERLAAAIYAPYHPYINRFGQYEEATLISTLDNILLVKWTLLTVLFSCACEPFPFLIGFVIAIDGFKFNCSTQQTNTTIMTS
jgi:hypothetical protein